MILSQLRCCGIKEINGLSEYFDPKPAMQEVCHLLFADPKRDDVYIPDNVRWTCHILFSQANPDDPDDEDEDESYDYGEKFADYIRDQKLGTVQESIAQYNLNSGNNVTVWVWSVDHDLLRDWFTKNPPTFGTTDKIEWNLGGVGYVVRVP